MNRRHFMQAILAAAIAPALVRAQSLMPVRRSFVIECPPITDFLTIEEARNAPFDFGVIRENLGLIWCTDLEEHKTQIGPLDILTSYRYSVPEIRVRAGGPVLRLFADGTELSKEAWTMNNQGVLTLKDLDLTPYGNCLPRLAADIDYGYEE